MNKLIKLKLIAAKSITTIQDLGRCSGQHLGFSVGGAADEFSSRYANHLVGNKPQDAVLELILPQLEFEVLNDCEIAITGANQEIEIDKVVIKTGHKLPVKKGQRITISRPRHGIYTYIAIAGGINSKKFLDSQSQTLSEIKLELGEPQLIAGSEILVNATSPKSRNLPDSFESLKVKKSKPLNLDDQLVLRFIPSPLWQTLSKSKQNILLNQPYIVNQDSNKMGYRLIADLKINIDSEHHIRKLSQPVSFGTIQLTNEGLPIVLMKERQTMGGYPVLGNVIKTDLFRLAQKRPGDIIQFIPCSLDFAMQQLRAFDQYFK